MDSRSSTLLRLFVLLSTILWCCHISNAINEHDFHMWRTCNHTFCARLRNYKPDKSPYHLIKDSIRATNCKRLRAEVVNNVTQDKYDLEINFLEHSTIRLLMNEREIHRERYHPQKALINKDPSRQEFKIIEKTEERVVVNSDKVRVVITVAPLKLEVYYNNANEPTIVMNDFGRLVMEYNQHAHGLSSYQETFAGHTDSRPYGPMAVALDFSFPSAKRMYGLAMHIENLALRSTTQGEPYRLFNCDFGDQQLHDGRAMYGSIPFAIAHGINKTAGIFWLNSADTWVDIEELNGVNSTGYNSFFMSETGFLDVFLMAGSDMYEVVSQYGALTGRAPIPPYWALGYHQSRWNYFSEKEVLEVAENFDKNGLPLDAIWLDIEYTDQKKYFTWDPVNFSNPASMINTLAMNDRKLVVIIDPHIKQSHDYKIFDHAEKHGLFVKRKDGRNSFIGICWPNESAWLDYANPEARDYWASLYSSEKFVNTTQEVYIWNDMNEPSVFDGPEKTFPKDLVHFDGWEHRDMHNIYGFLEVTATYEGLMRRSKGQKRPFVLTRSYFSGSQRYAAIWLGDNYSTWQSLRNSIPMCLTAALCGISFCGADVGGFFGNPEPELLYRWYQVGVYLPFFRAHSELTTLRREPYLQSEPVKNIIKQALQDRQIILPYYYTLFAHHSKCDESKPVIKPLAMEFPNDEDTFDIDNQFLIGDALMVRPIMEPNASGAEVYFPGKNEVWYHHKCSSCGVEKFGKRFVAFRPGYNTTFAFVRGGHILPTSASAEIKPLPSAKKVLESDLGLFIAPDNENKAAGSIYLDDGESFAYKEKKLDLLKFQYNGREIELKFLAVENYPVKQSITVIKIAGTNIIQKAVIQPKTGGEIELEVMAQPQITYIYAKKDQLPLNEEWTITLQ